MSKLNPESGDIFLINGLYPVIVVHVLNEIRGIFITNADKEPLTAKGGGKSKEELIRDGTCKFLFKLDWLKLEEIIMEKTKAGEFNNVPQDE